MRQKKISISFDLNNELSAHPKNNKKMDYFQSETQNTLSFVFKLFFFAVLCVKKKKKLFLIWHFFCTQNTFLDTIVNFDKIFQNIHVYSLPLLNGV